MVESCRVELRAEATGLQPAYPVPGLKLSMLLTNSLVTPPGLEPGLPA